jgi:ABC-type branched-subunit amino acid transport system substrate-binding protein
VPTVVFLGPAQDLLALRSSSDPKMPMVFAGDETDAEILAEATKDDNGPYWVGAYAPEKVPRDFDTKFKDKFKTSPTVDAMMAYDASRILFAAAHEVKSLNAAKLATRLKQPRAFETLNGPIEFGKDNQIARGPAYILQAKQGKAVVVKPLEPEKQ